MKREIIEYLRQIFINDLVGIIEEYVWEFGDICEFEKELDIRNFRQCYICDNNIYVSSWIRTPRKIYIFNQNGDMTGNIILNGMTYIDNIVDIGDDIYIENGLYIYKFCKKNKVLTTLFKSPGARYRRYICVYENNIYISCHNAVNIYTTQGVLIKSILTEIGTRFGNVNVIGNQLCVICNGYSSHICVYNKNDFEIIDKFKIQNNEIYYGLSSNKYYFVYGTRKEIHILNKNTGDDRQIFVEDNYLHNISIINSKIYAIYEKTSSVILRIYE